MECKVAECVGEYDFDHIAEYARKRFVEGYDTVTLMQQAVSEHEREQIALVCLLDVEEHMANDKVRVGCRYQDQCPVTNCRSRLREIIALELQRGRAGSKV